VTKRTDQVNNGGNEQKSDEHDMTRVKQRRETTHRTAGVSHAADGRHGVAQYTAIIYSDRIYSSNIE
jgi:hypothetical protein